MTRIVKPELAADLTDLFPVLEPRSLSPDEVSATLQLTHPFLTGTHKFRQMQSEAISAAVGVQSVNSSVVPKDRYRYVVGASIMHNDATARLRTLMYVPGSAAPSSFALASDLAPAQASGWLSAPRSFLLGPGGFLQGQVVGLTATAQLTIIWVWVEHLILDPHPHI